MLVRTNPRVLLLSFAVGLGAFLRLYPVLVAGFPLLDGGLFYTFIREMRQNSYLLPLFSAYNQGEIPFVYPPLSFYLAGILADLTGWSDLDVLRILPAILSTLTIPTCYLLAREILASEIQALLATFSFALLSTAYDFLIVGAGLPRSLAFLFSMLTLWQIHRLYTHDEKRHIFYASIFACLTLLSHPTIAWFTAYSGLLIFLFWGRRRTGWLRTGLVALGTLVLTAPWWLTMLIRHGITPFLSASQLGFRSWINLITPLLFLHTNEPYLKIQAVMGLLGLFVCLQKKQYFLPVWLGVVFLLEPRLAATYSVLPMVLLVATGLDEVVLRGLRNHPSDKQVQSPGIEAGNTPSPDHPMVSNGKTSGLLLSVFLLYSLVSSFIVAPKEALSLEHRTAMTWVGAETPRESQFLILSGIHGAGSDLISEWFPALSDRASLNTPQGLEWRDGRAFASLWNRHSRLQVCITVDCLEAWSGDLGVTFDYVYIRRAALDPLPLVQSLDESPDYQLVYENPQVKIFQRLAR